MILGQYFRGAIFLRKNGGLNLPSVVLMQAKKVTAS